MYQAIVNCSTRISDSDVELATRACARQLRYHVDPAWGIHTPAVVFSGHVDPKTEPTDETMKLPAGVPPGSYVIGLFDSDSEPDALAWHSEWNGMIFGRVNVGAVLDNGGSPLVGSLSVAAALSHEVVEAAVDPLVNVWCQDQSGVLWAREACDPVENWAYTTKIDGHDISVSDFVLPTWFDAYGKPGAKTHHMDNAVLDPFTIAPGGYAVKMSEGQSSQVFGEAYPEWRRATKGSPLARTARRTNEQTQEVNAS